MPDFAYFEFVEEWPELVIALNQLEARLRSHERPVAADMILRAYAELRDGLIAMGREMSVFATEALRRSERDTRVRPDTQGNGGPRLEDHLVAEPIMQGIMPGAIGVANEDVLDNGVPWWITNEIGSSARVGDRLFGTFYGQDDAGPPDMDHFREHPLFEPGKNGTLSGVGIIENPIPARRFIAKAVPVINREWQSRFTLLRAAFGAQFDAALAMPR